MSTNFTHTYQLEIDIESRSDNGQEITHDKMRKALLMKIIELDESGDWRTGLEKTRSVLSIPGANKCD